MINDRGLNIAALTNLVVTKSKHSDYQLLYPSLAALVPDSAYHPSGKHEQQRQAYMRQHRSLVELNVLDIGANTGYFSFGALDDGACKVVSQEGNPEHANFISLGARCLGLEDRMVVRPTYFDFSDANIESEKYDLILCLNVLHHLGDDFGNASLSLELAKSEMMVALNNLAGKTVRCWLQLGFNWKGNPNSPLFVKGAKSELIDFVKQGTQGVWEIEHVAVFDPAAQNYTKLTADNIDRFDQLGEFLNRPLFLLRSLRNEAPS